MRRAPGLDGNEYIGPKEMAGKTCIKGKGEEKSHVSTRRENKERKQYSKCEEKRRNRESGSSKDGEMRSTRRDDGNWGAATKWTHQERRADQSGQHQQYPVQSQSGVEQQRHWDQHGVGGSWCPPGIAEKHRSLKKKII